MAESLEQFAKSIRIVADRMVEDVDKLVRKTALVIDQTVVLATPVDTGKARSNWQVSVGAPKEGVIQPYAPGKRLGIAEGGNSQGAIAQANAVVATRQPGQDIYITNNVEYIGKLNDGSSKQAPANFVEIAIAAGSAAVDNAKVLKG